MSNSDFDREKFKWLMECATRALAREHVKINLWHPIVSQSPGQAYRETDGLKIDIDPSLHLEEFYEVWLHETSHILLGHCDNLPPRDLPKDIERAYQERGPLLERTPEEEEKYSDKPEEIEARALTESLDHVFWNGARRRYGSDDIESRLHVAIHTNLKNRRIK
jgi:hypothetical protein